MGGKCCKICSGKTTDRNIVKAGDAAATVPVHWSWRKGFPVVCAYDALFAEFTETFTISTASPDSHRWAEIAA